MEEGADRHPEVQKLHRGKMARKFEKRFGSVKKTLRDLQLRDISTPSGLYVGKFPTFRVEWPRMQLVLKNVMKGIFYSVREYPIPQDIKFHVEVATDSRLVPLKNLVGAMTPWSDFGDDVFRCRYVFEEGPEDAMVCLMQFYRNRIFFGVASPNLEGI
jgi:hypothetical protein